MQLGPARLQSQIATMAESAASSGQNDVKIFYTSKEGIPDRIFHQFCCIFAIFQVCFSKYFSFI